jgi:hypothetical protein
VQARAQQQQRGPWHSATRGSSSNIPSRPDPIHCPLLAAPHRPRPSRITKPLSPTSRCGHRETSLWGLSARHSHSTARFVSFELLRRSPHWQPDLSRDELSVCVGLLPLSQSAPADRRGEQPPARPAVSFARMALAGWLITIFNDDELPNASAQANELHGRLQDEGARDKLSGRLPPCSPSASAAADPPQLAHTHPRQRRL